MCDSQNFSFVVVIPVYNEASHLPALLELLHKNPHKFASIVIDDGSTDATAQLLQQAGIDFLRHSVNRGKGAALKSGLLEAKRRGYLWAITMDGDGQHDPVHLPLFIKTCSETDAQLVVGNRQNRNREKMPLHRQLSNRLTSLIITLSSGLRISDSQCGFRAYKMASTEWQVCRETGFQYETEVLLRIGKNGGKIAEIPVTTIYNDSPSHIRLLHDTVGFLWLLLRSLGW